MSSEASGLHGVPLAIELVNTVDMLNDPPDFLTDVERLRRFLVHVGHEAAAKKLTPADLAATRTVRDRITYAMEARDPSTAVARLDRMAGTLEIRPRAVATTAGSWEIRYGPSPDKGPGFIGPSAVMGLLQLVVDGAWDRIGRCAGAPCCCVFVDRSKNRSRRYCCQLCADRVNQARARRRRGRSRRSPTDQPPGDERLVSRAGPRPTRYRAMKGPR